MPTVNPLGADPTRTSAIRGRFDAVIRARHRLLKEAVPGVVAAALPGSTAFVSKIQIDQVVTAILLGQSAAGEWFRFVAEGYDRGLISAWGSAPPAVKRQLVFNASAQESLLRQMFTGVVTSRAEISKKVRDLGFRSLQEMEESTSKTATAMARVIADGVMRGKSEQSIVNDILGVVDVSEASARRIARTEFIRAHADAQLDGFDALGVRGVTAKVEWSARPGACPRCRHMAGAVFTVEKARGLIPVHPYCYCSWVPAPRDARTSRRLVPEA